MKKWDDVIKDALQMFVDRDKYCYFYGAKGQKMTDANMDALIKAEPKYFSQYTSEQLTQIKNYSRGKIGLDCSGFVGLVMQDRVWSGLLLEHCTYKT